MNLDELYNDIFPLGGVDNNNNYIEKPTEDIGCIQLLEPTIGVTELVITKKDRITANNIPERMAFRFPLVCINSSRINQEMMINFQLDYSGFVPTVMVEFVDMNNVMLSSNSLNDGSIIKVYIGGHGDELYYKPIRQDFIVTNIIKLNSGDQNMGDWIEYRITGSLNVPIGHRKDSWSNAPATSMQELFNLSVLSGLGFATNFTFTTIDEMKWVNTLGSTYFEFMQYIAEHACYSPNTFFTAFVDQYYVLNFVECHSLLSHGGTKKDTPAMIYTAYQDVAEPNKDKSANDGKNKETTDQINVGKDESDLMNANQKLSYYFLSNHRYFEGWTNYIESYNEISDGYASMDEGYRKHIIYSDTNACGWGSNVEFTIFPIDNMKRDDTSQQILSLDEKPSQNSYIPLNLMHTNNDEYQKESITDIDRMSNVESYVNLGEVDTSNMYKQYYFAEIQNEYQMRCMKKCGLHLTLQNYNPSITKYSRVWVDIYDMNTTSSMEISPDKSITINPDEQNDFKKYKQMMNDNIINYEDEGVFEMTTKTTDMEGNEVEQKGKNTNSPMGKYNRSLSGWYVVTEMKFDYNNYDRNMKTILTLNRIEHKPLYKADYTRAKKAIDKYKEENRVECIFGSIDDFSY